MKLQDTNLLTSHINADKEFQDKINRVLFGDDINEKGMKDKVDEMHSILMSARGVGGFFNGIKGILGWLLLVGAIVALIKGWFFSIFAYFLSANKL